VISVQLNNLDFRRQCAPFLFDALKVWSPGGSKKQEPRRHRRWYVVFESRAPSVENAVNIVKTRCLDRHPCCFQPRRKKFHPFVQRKGNLFFTPVIGADAGNCLDVSCEMEKAPLMARTGGL
jgi:hypothetical protein